ncbi:hypothetical protein OD257_003162 [Clostridioides difficile]|nr:hypothetical protein [Clostridioides difficile]
MDIFLLSVLASLIASLIVYLINKLFKIKVKNYSVRKSSFSFELKIKFKKDNH